MKAITTVMLTVCLMCLFCVAAYAETSVIITSGGLDDESGAVTVVDWADIGTTQNNDRKTTSQAGTGGYAAVPVFDVPAGRQPISVEAVTENGVKLIKKTYELPQDADPQTLVQDFEQDGYDYAAREIQRRALPGDMLTRPASKIASAQSDTDTEADILKHFPATIDFEEDGYTGQLHLDGSSFKTGEDAFETYTYSYTKAREIPGLSRNDPALIEREWDGMALSGMSFRQGNDGLYTAAASYKGTATGKRATGYVTTATYHGEISKEAPGNVLYTVVYEGLPLYTPVVLQAGEAEREAPEQQEQEQEPLNPVPDLPAQAAPEQNPPAMWWIIPVVALSVIAGTVFGRYLPQITLFIYTKIKKREDIEE